VNITRFIYSFFLFIFRFINVDASLLDEDLSSKQNKKFSRLNKTIVQLIEDFSIVKFIPLNIKEEDSIEYVLSHIDNAIQFGEDQEPKEPKVSLHLYIHF
jgi:hypothetical protein